MFFTALNRHELVRLSSSGGELNPRYLCRKNHLSELHCWFLQKNPPTLLAVVNEQLPVLHCVELVQSAVRIWQFLPIIPVPDSIHLLALFPSGVSAAEVHNKCGKLKHVLQTE